MRSFGELFCGAGGLTLGLLWSGMRPSWCIDCDGDSIETHRLNIGGKALLERVEDVDYGSLERTDGLVFGLPCNDFSILGEKKGLRGYYGGLYIQAARALDAVRPKWFLAENVPGMVGSGAEEVLRALEEAGEGYLVRTAMVEFHRHGVPQMRKRIIAVGLRRDLGVEWTPPEPSRLDPPTSRQALESIPPGSPNSEPIRCSEKMRILLSHIPPGENMWHPSVPKHLLPNVKGARMSIHCRRLHPDRPSHTIIAAGGGWTRGYHYDEPRPLTNRELAALQSFPHDFEFVGGKSSVRRQIGMAVPPIGALALGESLAEALEKAGA